MGIYTSMLPILTTIAGATGTPSSSTTRTGSASQSTGTTQTATATQAEQDTAAAFANMFQEMMQGTGTSTGTVTPTLSPESTALMNQLIQRYSAQANPSLTGYQAQQTQGINANADIQSQAVNNIMASRGLSTSPVAATAAAGVEQNRANQITSMQEQLPLLQNQLNLQNLAGATQLFSTLPKGQTTTGATTSQQIGSGGQSGQSAGTTTSQSGTQGASTTTQSGTSSGTTSTTGSTGGGVGGAAAGLASGIALSTALKNAYPNLGGGFGWPGSGPFASDPTGGGNFGTGLDWSDERLKKNIKQVPQEKAIQKIRELRGKTWNWKGEGDSAGPSGGLVAQDMEKVLPELVRNHAKDTNFKAIDYKGVLPYIIGAIQHLDKRTSKEA